MVLCAVEDYKNESEAYLELHGVIIACVKSEAVNLVSDVFIKGSVTVEAAGIYSVYWSQACFSPLSFGSNSLPCKGNHQ